MYHTSPESILILSRNSAPLVVPTLANQYSNAVLGTSSPPGLGSIGSGLLVNPLNLYIFNKDSRFYQILLALFTQYLHMT